MVLPRLIPRLSRSAFKVAQANNRVFNAPFRGMASSAGVGSGKIRYVTRAMRWAMVDCNARWIVCDINVVMGRLSSVDDTGCAPVEAQELRRLCSDNGSNELGNTFSEGDYAGVCLRIRSATETTPSVGYVGVAVPLAYSWHFFRSGANKLSSWEQPTNDSAAQLTPNHTHTHAHKQKDTQTSY